MHHETWNRAAGEHLASGVAQAIESARPSRIGCNADAQLLRSMRLRKIEAHRSSCRQRVIVGSMRKMVVPEKSSTQISSPTASATQMPLASG